METGNWNCAPPEVIFPAEGSNLLIFSPENRPTPPYARFNSAALPRAHWPARPEIGLVGTNTRPIPRARDGMTVLMSPKLWLAFQPPSSGIPHWSMCQVLPRSEEHT